MAYIGDLVVRITASTSQFEKSLAKSQGLFGKFVSVAKNNLGALAAGYASFSALRGALSEATTAIQTQKKLQAVLSATGHAAGLSAEEITNFASELQKVTNFGDDATINAAAMLATFKEIKGDVFKDALKAAADLSTVMEQDMKSSIVQIGKALNDPIKGVTALTRVGVSFTEEQKKQIRVLQESGDLMGAQAIILAELKSEFGGAAEAMADPVVQMNNAIGDFAENIGFLALPSIRALSEAIGNLYGQADQNAFVTMGEDIAFMFTNFGDVAQLAFWNVAETAVGAIEHVYASVAGVFGSVAELGNYIGTIWEGFFNGVNAAFDALISGNSPIEAFQKAMATAFSDSGPIGQDLSKAFTAAQEDAYKSLQGKTSLSGIIKDQKQALLDDIGNRNAAQEAAKKAVAVGGAVGGIAALAEEVVKVAKPIIWNELLGDGTPSEVKQDPGKRLSGALQRGSSEAYSLLVNAGRVGDQTTKAVEKQTDVILNDVAKPIKKWSEAAPLAVMENILA